MTYGPPSPFALAAAGVWPPGIRPSRRPIQMGYLGPRSRKVVARLLGEELLEIFEDEGEPAICWSAVNSYLAAGFDLEPED